MTVRSFTATQYVALGLEGPWVSPFALENRRARDDRGGDGHYYLNRGHTILGIVLHITAGITGIPGSDRSAENTTQYGRTTKTAASWTTISDSDSCINSLHPLRVAFVQGVAGYNFNRPLWGHEIGKADSNWAKMNQVWVDATLYHAAVMLAPVVIKYGIPLQLITDRDEVQRRINRGQVVGFTYHWRLTPGSRSDPGLSGNTETFPIERFFHFMRIAIAQLQGKPVPAPPVQPDPSVRVAAGTVLEVTAAALNCRSGPGTQHDVTGTAPRGTLVTATGRTSGAWLEGATSYQAGERISAWWHSGYLKVAAQPNVAVKAVQTHLAYLGYDLGPSGVDGAPGAMVTAAVAAYATDNNYPGSRTAWAALAEHMEDTIMTLKADIAELRQLVIERTTVELRPATADLTGNAPGRRIPLEQAQDLTLRLAAQSTIHARGGEARTAGLEAAVAQLGKVVGLTPEQIEKIVDERTSERADELLSDLQVVRAVAGEEGK